MPRGIMAGVIHCRLRRTLLKAHADESNYFLCHMLGHPDPDVHPSRGMQHHRATSTDCPVRTTAMFSGPLKSFRATHPSFVPATTITRILSGIRVRSSFQDAVAAPLFSPEEIAFLASLISNALARRTRTNACGSRSVRLRASEERCSLINQFSISP